MAAAAAAAAAAEPFDSFKRLEGATPRDLLTGDLPEDLVD